MFVIMKVKSTDQTAMFHFKWTYFINWSKIHMLQHLTILDISLFQSSSMSKITPISVVFLYLTSSASETSLSDSRRLQDFNRLSPTSSIQRRLLDTATIVATLGSNGLEIAFGMCLLSSRCESKSRVS